MANYPYVHPDMSLNDVLRIHHEKIDSLERQVRTLRSMLSVVDDVLAGVRRTVSEAHAVAIAAGERSDGPETWGMDPLPF